MDLPEKHIVKPETSYIHELDVEVFYFNEFGVMKPSAYQALFAKLAESHLDIFNAGADETLKYGLAWALISMSIEIKRPVDSCEKLNAHTWYSGRQGPFYRRELVFSNERGDTMFCGSTFSVLLDVKERKVFRKKELPFWLTEPDPLFCIDASHRFKESVPYMPHETRKVYGSDMDLLGHVNNRRYGDFAYDALTSDEQLRLKDVKRMDLYFVSEMRKDDSFTVLKSIEPDRILLRGHNNTKDDISFDIIFRF